MNCVITDEMLDKIIVIQRRVADINNRIAQSGVREFSVSFGINGGIAALHVTIYRWNELGAFKEDGRAWYYNNNPADASYEDIIKFFDKWEAKFPALPKEENATEAFYIDKGNDTWRETVYECSNCGQEFMVDRRVLNWCPSCGRALDCDVNGELEKGEQI